MSRLSERADNAVKKFVKPKPMEDNRSPEEKLAHFHERYEPKSLKEARRRMKSARSRV